VSTQTDDQGTDLEWPGPPPAGAFWLMGLLGGLLSSLLATWLASVLWAGRNPEFALFMRGPGLVVGGVAGALFGAIVALLVARAPRPTRRRAFLAGCMAGPAVLLVWLLGG
jgi:hypothetical protein